MGAFIVVGVGLLFIFLSPFFQVPSSIKNYAYPRKVFALMTVGFFQKKFDTDFVWPMTSRGLFLAMFGDLIVIVGSIIFVSNLLG